VSNDLNLWQGIGRLGKDPEVRFSPAGKAIANFSIACGSTWTDKSSGDKKEKTEWVRLIAFDKLAEIIGSYCKKGTQIYVSGRLQTREYEKDGAKRYITEIVIDKMQLLGPKPAGDKPETPQTAANKPPASAAGQADFDDDIPF
jgi:single-strand DNA-binding protein